jgi:hypothetical protein
MVEEGRSRVKNSCRLATINTVLLATLLLAAAPGEAQEFPKDPEERAKFIARLIQAHSTQITLFDRQGRQTATVGPKDLHYYPVFSPDGKRVAVKRADPKRERIDLCVLDVATGKETLIYESQEDIVALNEEAVRRALVEGGLRVATAEDLIVLKLIANRPKDQNDLRGLLELPDLDWPYVEHWAGEWGVLDALRRLRASAVRRL